MPRGKRTRVPVDVGAGVAEALDRRRVVADLDADLLEDRVGVVLEDLEPFVGHQLVRLHRPREERLVRRGVRGAQRLAAATPAAAAARLGSLRFGSGAHASTSCRRRRRPRPPPSDRSDRSSRSGSATSCPRCGLGAVACGNAIAATNSSWKRGSVAVSIFTTSRTACSISARSVARQQRLHGTGARRVADGADTVERAVGHEPEHHRVERVDVGAERSGEPDVGDLGVAGVLDEQVDAGPQRGLGELDRAHVVLRDRDPLLARARRARTRTCGRPRRCAACARRGSPGRRRPGR